MPPFWKMLTTGLMKDSAVSSIETSRLRPFPVVCRSNRAPAMANAAVTPVAMSVAQKPVFTGPVSGWPVIDIMPDAAWIAGS